jgi:hypothetical protein
MILPLPCRGLWSRPVFSERLRNSAWRRGWAPNSAQKHHETLTFRARGRARPPNRPLTSEQNKLRRSSRFRHSRYRRELPLRSLEFLATENENEKDDRNVSTWPLQRSLPNCVRRSRGCLGLEFPESLIVGRDRARHTTYRTERAGYSRQAPQSRPPPVVKASLDHSWHGIEPRSKERGSPFRSAVGVLHNGACATREG